MSDAGTRWAASWSSAPARAPPRRSTTCTARFPEAEVCAVFAKYGYTPADDSPFANRIFDPEAVDVYFQSTPEVKQSLVDYHRSTNYSVVDMDLIESLYATMYREKVQGHERLRMRNVSRIRDVATLDDRLDVTVEFLPTGEREVLSADLLVHATGYRPRDLDATPGQDREALPAGRQRRRARRPRPPRGGRARGHRGHLSAGRDRAHARPHLDPAVHHGRALRRDPRLPARPPCERRGGGYRSPGRRLGPFICQFLCLKGRFIVVTTARARVPSDGARGSRVRAPGWAGIST